MENYLDSCKEDKSSLLKEPVINLEVGRTLAFLEKHYRPNITIEDGLPLQEGFDILRSRINRKFNEKDSVVS